MQTFPSPPDDSQSVDSLPISTRAQNALRTAGIRELSQLCAMTPLDLMAMKNVGRITCDEIVRVLRRLGYGLRGHERVRPPKRFATIPPTIPHQAWINLPLQVLNLPASVVDELGGRRIRTVGELCRSREQALPPRCREPVMEALQARGLGLEGPSAPDPMRVPLLRPVPSGWEDLSIDVLGLSGWSRTPLVRERIMTVGQLCRLRPSQLLGIHSFGQACLNDVRTSLAHYYLSSQTGEYDEEATQPPAMVRAGVHAAAASPFDSAQALAAAAVETEDESLDLLELSRRPANVLHRAGIRTLDQLCACSAWELIQLPNMGRTSLTEVVNALARLGRHLSDGTQGDPNPPDGLGPPPDAATLADWLDLLLEGELPRPREVLVLRAGLYSGEPPVLEEVGKRIGVTREWIRQMERKGRERLRRRAIFCLARFSGQIAALIRSAGGVVRLADIIGAISHIYPANGVNVEAFARLTFPYCQDLVDLGDDLWATREMGRGAYRQVVDTLEAFLEAEGMPLLAPELLARAAAEHPDQDPRLVEACLKTSPRFWLWSDHWVFLADWKRSIKARWVLVALREIGRPAHFAEIAARLRELRPELTGLRDQSVHAILGRMVDEVDRSDGGTFALKNWGVGTDRYIVGFLEEALEQIGGPATIEQLAAYVMERKDCQAISVRYFLENDRRFLRLHRNVYTLTRWAGEGGTAEQLAEIRSVPLHPDWILSVLSRLVTEGRLSREELRLHLAEFRQVGRADDYVHYLTRRGWAAYVDGGLVPTGEARRLIALPDEAERLFRFAMADANFQAYLILLFVEYLIRRSWTADGAERVSEMLRGSLAPLRPICRVLTDRLHSRCSPLASAEEREMQLLQVVLAPAVPQVFSRWTKPVTGYNPIETKAVCNGMLARMGTFPAWPSTVHLALIPRPEARILFLAAAVAALDDGAVDYHRLGEHAALAGMECPGLAALAAELLVSGVFLDDRDPSRVRLFSPHRVIVDAGESLAGFSGDLDSLRASLWEKGVLVSHCDPTEPPPEVRLELVNGRAGG